MRLVYGLNVGCESKSGIKNDIRVFTEQMEGWGYYYLK